MIKIDDRKFLEMIARGFGCAEWEWVRDCESLMLGELEWLQECYYDEVYLDGEVWISWEDWLEECTVHLIMCVIIEMMSICVQKIDMGSGIIIDLMCEQIEDIISSYKHGLDQDLRGIAEHINNHGRWV